MNSCEVVGLFGPHGRNFEEAANLLCQLLSLLPSTGPSSVPGLGVGVGVQLTDC